MATPKKRRSVGELMNPDVFCLSPQTSLRAAGEQIAKRRVSGAPVVDERGRPLGVVSQSDLVRRAADHVTAGQSGRFYTDVEDYQDIAELPIDDSDKPVETIMAREVYTVTRDTGVAVAASIMRERRVHRLIVTDRGIVVGVVTALDLLRVLEELG
ncbi:MAG TPA: CBS domain-containing protein [Myxococcota bacterium]|jgi:CBS domain-containing protein|nr:CBS domain-containing protein [Myxococcota bacterium]